MKSVGEYQPLSRGLFCRAYRSSTSPEPSIVIYCGCLAYYILLNQVNVSTSSCAVPLKYMVSSKKIPVCTSRDNYVWHQISGKTIACSSHSNKLRCKTISLLVSSQFQCFITTAGVDFFSSACSSPSSLGSIIDKLRLQCKIWHVNYFAQVQH